MKRTLLMVGLLLASSGAFAADEMIFQYTCHRYPAIPDNGITAYVSDGGLLPHTELQVVESFLATTRRTTYWVEEVPSWGASYSDIETHGRKANLFIDQATKLPDGGMKSTLTRPGRKDAMSCRQVK